MTLSFEPLVPWTWIGGAALALFLAELVPLWMRRGAVSRGRTVLIALMGGLAALAALALLARPTVTTEERRPVRAVVLVDASRSMATADAPGGRTRYEAAVEAARVLAQSRPGARIEIEAFSSQGVTTTSGSLPTAPAGGTAIGDALARTLARAPGGREPLAAIAIVSDGGPSSGREPVAVAREALAARVRVFTLATGTADSRPAPRLGRATLVAPERAAAGSTATVRAAVEARGLDAVPVDLELSLDGKVVGRTTVEGGAPGDAREAAFEVALGAEGVRALSLRAVAGSRSSRADARVHVLPGRVRVALLDAPGRWEHRYLRRALEDSARITLERVDVWGAAGSSGDATPPAIAAIASADVVILGDVPARALAPAVGEAITRAVEDGAGLLVLAGKRGFEEARTLGLAPLLPVDVPGGVAPVGEPVRPSATDAGRALLATALGVRERDLATALDRLPPLPSYVPLPPARREATVLLEAPSRRPLIALGRHGLGRTSVLATDTTWRWAFSSREERASPADREALTPGRVHAALIRELTLVLAPRDAGLKPPAELVAGPARVQRGDGVLLGVRFHDPSLGVPDAEVALVDPASGTTLASARCSPLAPATLELPRTFEGGAVVAVVVARDPDGRDVARDERILDVAREDVAEEAGEPADPALLARIADAGGGAGFACEDVARGTASVAIAGALEAAMPVERRSGPLAAGPGYAVLLALLYGASWALRRGGGLA